MYLLHYKFTIFLNGTIFIWFTIQLEMNNRALWCIRLVYLVVGDNVRLSYLNAYGVTVSLFLVFYLQFYSF